MIDVLCCTTKLHTGGVQTFFVNYAPLLLKHGVRMNFAVQTAEEQPLDKFFTDLGCNIHPVTPMAVSKWAYIRDVKRLLRAHPEYKIVHAHMNFANFYPLWAARQVGAPVRVSHSHSYYSFSSFFNFCVKELWKRVLLPVVVTDYWACSQKSAEWLYGAYAKSAKCAVIPNAINADRFKFDAERRENLRQRLGLEGQFVWVHVGTLSGAKNHRFLIDLFGNFHARHPQSKLLLCGDGVLREEISQHIKEQNLEGAVVMLGDVRNCEDYLFSADLYVFPSLHEGFSLSSLEAQTTGIPCLVSQAVPAEAAVADNVKRILAYEADEWLSEIEKTYEAHRAEGNEANKRQKYYEQVAASRYNTDNAARLLAEKYLDCYRSIN